MKETFLRLPEVKREKVIQACIEEFGKSGYENSSTDRIIRKAGISKGGLYEYISSKKELFIYVVEYSYKALYDYLREQIHQMDSPLPQDILERVRLISSMAIDFYLDHPRFVSLITKTHQISDAGLAEEIQEYFTKEFLDIFGNTSEDSLRFPRKKILDLLAWLLLKTRYEFLVELEKEENIKTIHDHYLKNWDFYISILSEGIYKIPSEE